MCDELQSVQILRNDFINNYSHEFKTPIASINGFAELLREKKLPEEERDQYLKIIADESARLSKLASNTTLLSRLSSQQIVSGIEEYDLGAQLRECSIILSGKWLGKDIAFDGEDIPSLIYKGNKEMMQHLWINLLDNSIKYTPEGGEIKVSLAQKDGFAVVKIADNGEGISDETKARLFIPYFQGDASHSKEGLGLGLAIVMRIVELCKGNISVDSAVNEGSVFTVKLPL
jgi:signal transduction histidine kinase